MGISGGPDMINDSSLVLSLDASDRNSYVSGSTTWFDLSGNNITGSLVNEPLFTTTYGDSFKFDAIDDYIDLGLTRTICPLNQVTVSQWIYNTTYEGRKALISNNQAAGYSLYLWDNRFEAYFHINGSWRVPGISNVGYSGWVNLTGTYDNRYARLYVNGLLASTVDTGGTFPITYNATVPMWIGLEPLAGGTIQGFGYDGYIATTQIYTRALSDSEILQNYNALKSRFNL